MLYGKKYERFKGIQYVKMFCAGKTTKESETRRGEQAIRLRHLPNLKFTPAFCTLSLHMKRRAVHQRKLLRRVQQTDL